MDLNTVLCRRPEVVYQVVEDEAVLVLPEQGQVQVLNETGAFIWQRLDGRQSLAEVVEQVCRHFEVAPEQAAQDVLEFAAALLESALVDRR